MMKLRSTRMTPVTGVHVSSAPARRFTVSTGVPSRDAVICPSR